MLFNSLVWITLRQITQFFIVTRMLDIYLVVYVSDIVLIGSDHHDISQVKQCLFHHFQTKDFEKIIYFLGIEVAQPNIDTVISKMNYELDISDEIGLMNSKDFDLPINPNAKLLANQGESLSNLEKYKRLFRKLNYLTIAFWCFLYS